MKNFDKILLRSDESGVATLTLNRPNEYNSLSENMLDALQTMFASISSDKSVRVVVLQGAGEAFCAGHDLKEMSSQSTEAYFKYLFMKCSKLMLGMMQLPQPIIARVHGVATAAGCQLVATADLAVASHRACFGTSGINVGLFCMTPGVALSRNLTRKKAFEMLVTGDFISAEKAVELGLVNKAVSSEDLDEELGKLLKSVLDKSQPALEAGKRLFYQQIEMGIGPAYQIASSEMARNMMFDDVEEGIDAFIGKRKPVWMHKKN